MNPEQHQSPAIEIITTADGSHSLFLPHLNETYHSRHGALQESRYVYIDKGLDYIVKQGAQQVNVLEVGFGTGLNALLSYEYARLHGITVNYHTLEPYPIPANVAGSLNYGAGNEAVWQQLHNAEWNTEVAVSPFFNLHKINTRLEDYAPTAQSVDVVYYDAFGPSKQAEIWQPHNLQKCYAALKPGGAMVTYCAQGQFKRHLAALGFTVQVMPGPPYKKEMVRAVK